MKNFLSSFDYETASKQLPLTSHYYQKAKSVGLVAFLLLSTFTTAFANPEIGLLGNVDNNIANGSTTPSTTNGTDFGNVALTGANQLHAFTITNFGTSDLLLTGTPEVAISGANAADFTVIGSPGSSVSAPNRTVFTIRFDPSAAGLRTATVTIPNNDADEGPFTFAIQGYGGFPFLTTWKTDNAGSSNSTSITIPTVGSGYNYDVDWDNDGTFDEFGLTGNATHDYGVAGTVTVAIQGDFPRIFFNNVGDKAKILSVEQWGDIAWSSMNSAFYGCENLVINAMDVPDLSGVTNMTRMFLNARSFNQPIDNWNVSTVTNMFQMFAGASSFDQDISSWNVGAVTVMSAMFRGASSFDQDISSWNVGAVTEMGSMFLFASSFNQSLAAWGTKFNTNVDLTNMLSDCGMDIANYDATLTGFNAGTVTGRTLGATGREYCAAKADRDNLVLPVANGGKGWTISGDAADCPCITAAATTWTGTVDSNWDDDDNWTNCQPGTITDATIPAAPSNQPTLNVATAVAKSVEVQSGATLTITNNGILTINDSKNYMVGTTTRSSAFLNRGTVANNGKIVLGNTSSIGQFGLWNTGIFNNNMGGEINIDNSTNNGLNNNSGTFTNAAKIIIGANAGVGNDGLDNRATFDNNTGGEINIDNSTSNGLYNASGTFTNAAKIIIGANASVGNDGIHNQATFNNNTGGEINIDNSTSNGLNNASGTFTNTAKIIIGANASVGNDGLKNQATFNNNTGGEINIDNSIDRGLYHLSNTFTNAAKIIIGANASVGEDGLRNQATFDNNAGGEININNSTSNGLYNASGTFTNAAKIIIGANASVGEDGLRNQSTFNNNAGGEINIDNSSERGLYHLSNTFTNAAKIIIGANTSVGEDGLRNQATFNNAACAKITMNASFNGNNNNSVFTNDGAFIINTSQAHINNNTFTNNGVLDYLQTTQIPSVTNNGLTNKKTIATACPASLSPALDLGNSNTLTVDGIFLNAAATQSAGTYVQATNTFTPTTAFAEGVDNNYFVKITDATNNCTSVVVAWTVEAMGVCPCITATATTWTGTVDSNWDNDDNWTDCKPGAITDVIIADVTNAPIISNGTNAFAKSVAVQANASLLIAGNLKIENSEGARANGLVVDGSVTVQNTGNLTIDNTVHDGIRVSTSGQFINQNIVNIGLNGGVDNVGLAAIFLQGTLTNEEGTITIKNTKQHGILIQNGATLNNEATIDIGKTSFFQGISNFGNLNNHVDGLITIDDSAAPKIRNAATILNEGTIEIGANGNIIGIFNLANFTNAACAKITMNARFNGNNNSVFTNHGAFTINTSDAHVNDNSFTNNGLLAYQQTTRIPNVTNNGFTNQKTIATACPASLSPALDLGNSNTLTVDGIFLDAAATQSAGTYVQATNTFTPTTAFADGVDNNYFVKITDTGNSCTSIVTAWTVEAAGSCACATATATTWTGAVDSDWDNDDNWTDCKPGTITDVTIPAAPSNQPTLDVATAVAKSVEVQSGATLTIANSGVLTINDSKNFMVGTTTLSSAFLNRGTVANNGKIVLGNTSSIGQFGLWNTGTFNNNAGGEINIDNSSSRGLRNFSGTFTNAAKIIIGANESVGIVGLENQATFNNNTGGEINIDNSTFSGLYNDSGTFTNAAKIIIGANASVGTNGLQNRATFDNNTGSEIIIDNSSVIGLLNFTGTGTFTNAAKIIIGANASVGNEGLRNQATFDNNTGSEIIIDNSISIGLYNASGTFTNAAKIIIGTNESVGSNGLQNRATFNNNTGGEINIDNSTSSGLYNASGTFTNAAKIIIGANASVGQDGLRNQVTFNNNTGGEINIDNSSMNGLLNFSGIGTFTNAAKIIIGANASVGSEGLDNQATFNNNTGGEINIDNSTFSGLYNESGTFTNAAKIIIGANESVGTNGLYNRATFDNNTGSEINIDNSTSNGLYNQSGTFTNAAKIIIGANVSVGNDGLDNRATFTNAACANITMNARFNGNNNSVFTNHGAFTINTSQAHTNNNTFTNNGILEYLQTSQIPNVTNNGFTNQKTVATACPASLSPALDLGSATALTVDGVFLDAAATMSAGSYVQATNTFTPTTAFAEGVDNNYFVKITDTGNGCTSVVTAWTVEAMGTCACATATATTWTGAVDTDWDNDDNWTDCKPGTITDVTIPAAPSNQPTLNVATAVAKSVQVKSGATLTITNNGILTINDSKNFTVGTTTRSSAFLNQGTVTNNGKIVLGNTSSIGQYGLWNTGIFNNNTGGEINIDRSSTRGLDNFSGTFTNAAKIIIGANASVGNDGLENRATFTNVACANITMNARFNGNNSSVFTNHGAFTINTSDAHVNDNSFTNNGILAYLQTTQIPNVTNSNGFTNQKTTATACPASLSPALDLGSATTLTIDGIFLNAAATQSAGTYVQATNTFTPTTAFAEGVDNNYFVKITDGGNGCTSVVTPWTVEASGSCCTTPILSDLTDENICVDGSFTAANVTTSVTNGGTVNYQWYNDNGTDNPNTDAISGQTTATLTALPTAVGSYKYRVEATRTDDSDCKASQTVTLTIYTNLTAGISSDATDNTITQGESVTFTGSGGSRYEFFVNDQIVQANSATNTYTTTTLADGDKVKVRVSNLVTTCSEFSQEITMTVNCGAPVLTDLTDESICIDGSFTAANVTTSVTNTVAVTYQWYNDNGTDNPNTNAISGQTNEALTALPTAAGTYKYRVEATRTDDSDCKASKMVTLTIYNNLAAGISSDATDNTITQGESVTFTGAGGSRYEFFVNNQVVQANSDISTYTTTTLADGDKVKVRVSNLVTTCSEFSQEITMTVNSLNTSAAAGPDQLNICGTTAQLAATEPNIGTGQWTATPADGSFVDATKANTQFTGQMGVSYTLTWTVTGASDQVQISFNGDADNDTVQDCIDLCPMGDDRINTDGTGMPDACDCDPNDAQDETVNLPGTIITKTDLDEGLYQSSLELFSTARINPNKVIEFKAGKQITLQAGFHAQAGTDFTASIEYCNFPNNALVDAETQAFRRVIQEALAIQLANDRTSSNNPAVTLKTQLTAEIGLTVGPNPFRDATTAFLDLSKATTVSITVFDAQGRLVKMVMHQAKMPAGKHAVEIKDSQITTGVYYVHLRTEVGNVVRKVIALR